jgi:CubicO group peptidase (beta-lactamase class C family)
MDMASSPPDIPYTGKIYDRVSRLQPDPNALVQNNTASRIDDYLTEMEQRGFSGAILISKEGRVILAKGYGYANRAEKIPFHTHTAFDIGSITKQFTGAAILKLGMLGKISVSDRITEYFENVPEDKQSITLHHLLTHSAGLEESLGFDYASVTREVIRRGKEEKAPA